MYCLEDFLVVIDADEAPVECVGDFIPASPRQVMFAVVWVDMGGEGVRPAFECFEHFRMLDPAPEESENDLAGRHFQNVRGLSNAAQDAGDFSLWNSQSLRDFFFVQACAACRCAATPQVNPI